MTGNNKMAEAIKTEIRHRGALWVGLFFATLFGAIAGYSLCANIIGEQASKEVAGIREAYNEAAKARMSQLTDVTERLGQCLVITAKSGEAASQAANQAASAANQAATAADKAATALDKVATEPKP